MPISLTRRNFVSGIALLAGSGQVDLGFLSKAEAAGEIGLESFLAMSRHLVDENDLDKTMGAAILKSFVNGGLEDELASLVANVAAHGKSKMGDQVVAAWYTGLSPDGKTVTDFNSALVWQAMSFSKPWASCGGEYGYWGDAPAKL